MTNKAAKTKQQERGEEGTQPGPISCQKLAAKERSGPTSCQNRAAKESRSRAHQVQPRRIRKGVKPSPPSPSMVKEKKRQNRVEKIWLQNRVQIQ